MWGCSGLIWLGVGGTSLVRDGGNVLGLLFFEVVFLSFSAMFSALFTFPEEYKHVLKVTTLSPALACLRPIPPLLPPVPSDMLPCQYLPCTMHIMHGVHAHDHT